MDKNAALKLSRDYLIKVRSNDIRFSEAWLFGSYARGSQHENSDIDIAIVLKEGENKSFDTEVKLMAIRRGEKTLIEPHAFTKDEFSLVTPMVSQIIESGERIKV